MSVAVSAPVVHVESAGTTTTTTTMIKRTSSSGSIVSSSKLERETSKLRHSENESARRARLRDQFLLLSSLIDAEDECLGNGSGNNHNNTNHMDDDDSSEGGHSGRSHSRIGGGSGG